MLKVVVCDDHHSQCTLMELWLQQCPGVRVVKTCRTRELAILACREYEADVLVMDYSMPEEMLGDRGFMVRDLPRQLPHTPVLLWTGYERTDLPTEVVLSVGGVLVKSIDAEAACDAVKAVALVDLSE